MRNLCAPDDLFSHQETVGTHSPSCLCMYAPKKEIVFLWSYFDRPHSLTFTCFFNAQIAAHPSRLKNSSVSYLSSVILISSDLTQICFSSDDWYVLMWNMPDLNQSLPTVIASIFDGYFHLVDFFVFWSTPLPFSFLFVIKLSHTAWLFKLWMELSIALLCLNKRVENVSSFPISNNTVFLNPVYK